MSVVIIWALPLAVFIKKLLRKPINVQKCAFNTIDFIKRIGVYYMCIDDLPL